MIGFDAVFIDSVAFIYLIENHPKYFDRVRRFIGREIENENSLITSVISVSEFCVKPFRENDTTILADFKEALEQLEIRVLDINFDIAEQSSRLRAKYKSLKTADALQIASALSFNCKRFLTNDLPLKSIEEIEVILIEDLN
jgi:predicted nucleic acid-binding protein